MDAAYRSTKSPYSGSSPTKLVTDRSAPELLNDKVVKAYEKDQVLAAALSEYCRLKEDGAVPRIEEFCRRYPTYHKSIQRMIDVEETLGKLDDLDEAEWPEVGSSFMGFDVLHELGVGAFARVYLASEPALGGRLVAVKVAMFGSDEAETLGKLVHPNVVPVHSVRDDPDSGMTAVCMPYLGSATLSDVIEQVFLDGVPQKGSAILEAVARREVVDSATTGLSAADADKELRRGSYVDAVVRLGIQMADALVYTHAHGVLHRDLKPSNVLITPAGQPKLLDFNLSCEVETEVNRLGGTLPYMPPEQIKDVFLCPLEAKPPTDPRSDIFSLGVILYELFTGQLPFGIPPSDIPPREAGAIYLEAQQLPPRPIQKLNPTIESQTARLIERCIAPNPDCRPADAASLVAGLSGHFSRRRQVRRWSLARKKPLLALGLVMVAMLLLLVWHLATRPPRDRQLYNQGLAAIKHQDFDRAIQCFDQAMDLNQDEPAIRFARGLCLGAKHEHQRAQNDFVPIAAGECDAIVKEVYAYSWFELKKAHGAVPLYEELIALYPDRIDLKVNLALASLYSFGNSDVTADKRAPGNAFALAREILRIDPTCQAAHHIRAICTFWYLEPEEPIGDVIDVLQDVETALAMKPGNPDLEKRRMRLLAMIAGNDPQMHEALIAETKPRLWRLAPDIEESSVDSLAWFLKSIADEQWFASVKARCRKTPETTLVFQIAVPPSDTAIQEYLDRAWH